MARRVPVHLLDPEGGSDGQVPVIEGGVFVVGDAPGGTGGGDPGTDLFGEPIAGVRGGDPALIFDSEGGFIWGRTA